jgi:hypothetical protein
MRRFLFSLLGLVLGFVAAAFLGYWAIELFSSNGYDRSLEATMTAFFAIGPAGAIVGLIAGLVLGRAKRA